MADMAQRYVPPAPSGTVTTTTEAAELEETAREKTQELKETARERSTELTTKARTWMNEEADQRSSALGSQARTIANAMRETSSRLREEGQEQPARFTQLTADRIEQLATYLTDADGERLINDVTETARRQPWLFAAGGLALGFAASRFIKASGGSSRNTYRAYGPSSGSTVEGRTGMTARIEAEA
jgi:gas vesicle protein